MDTLKSAKLLAAQNMQAIRSMNLFIESYPETD
jgi:hypothetical protein